MFRLHKCEIQVTTFVTLSKQQRNKGSFHVYLLMIVPLLQVLDNLCMTLRVNVLCMWFELLHLSRTVCQPRNFVVILFRTSVVRERTFQ